MSRCVTRGDYSGEDLQYRLRGRADARLLHGDLGLLHVFVDPATLRITSLVDFGECAAGDPAYDFRDFDSAELRPLLAGYGSPVGFAERIPYYVLTQAIPWAAKWHGRGEPQVVEFLQDVLTAFG